MNLRVLLPSDADRLFAEPAPCALRRVSTCATAYFFLSERVAAREQVSDLTVGCSSGAD